MLSSPSFASTKSAGKPPFEIGGKNQFPGIIMLIERAVTVTFDFDKTRKIFMRVVIFSSRSKELQKCQDYWIINQMVVADDVKDI